MNRRDLLSLAGACAADGLASSAFADAGGWPREVALGLPQPFSFEQLKVKAAALAKRPFDPGAAVVAKQPKPPDYRPEATLWKDEAGDAAIRLFPAGRMPGRPVALYIVSGAQARPVVYADTLFEGPAAGRGFSGFRAMNADHRTDWVAFLGASYFRSADPFNQYGLSARGLAIDTAAARPEEFPAFTDIWLERGAGGQLVVYALLQGPSVAGAYRIAHARSPKGLVQDVEAQLAFRTVVERLGVAPLTSMYWCGPCDRGPTADGRPQVHDSDGLAIWTGAGERIWRPLADPPRVITNSFLDNTPRGFGLMQRDRTATDYGGQGLFYDRRPSAWVEPIGDWGKGSVQLVEIPTAGENEDNIVAFWTPAAPVAAGSRLSVRYRLYWTDEEPEPPGVARVVATRCSPAGKPGSPPPGRRRFAVDFAGPGLAPHTRPGDLEPVVTVDPGAALDVVAVPLTGTQTWRLTFDAPVTAGAVVNMRAFLRKGQNALTETWFHQAFGP